jgi:hypothetical protein
MIDFRSISYGPREAWCYIRNASMTCFCNTATRCALKQSDERLRSILDPVWLNLFLAVPAMAAFITVFVRRISFCSFCKMFTYFCAILVAILDSLCYDSTKNESSNIET